jgi:broad specificity phosphatase PhoE
MMSKLTKQMAKVLSFAHLTGVAGKRAEEDDKDRREEAEDDDPDKKEQDREDYTGKKSKRAEDDDQDKDKAEGDDPDDDEKDSAKADDQDAEDDEEEEMRGKSAAASARRRERARCAAIFGSKAAGRNPVLAANLAFNTSMTRKEALAVLESTPASIGTAEFAGGRAARNPAIGSGAPSTNRTQQTASRWDAAFKKASGRR